MGLSWAGKVGKELINASKQVMEHHLFSEQGSGPTAVCGRCVMLVAVRGEERMSM